MGTGPGSGETCQHITLLGNGIGPWQWLHTASSHVQSIRPLGHWSMPLSENSSLNQNGIMKLTRPSMSLIEADGHACNCILSSPLRRKEV